MASGAYPVVVCCFPRPDCAEPVGENTELEIVGQSVTDQVFPAVVIGFRRVGIDVRATIPFIAFGLKAVFDVLRQWLGICTEQ